MMQLKRHENVIQLMGLCFQPKLSLVMELLDCSLFDRLRQQPFLSKKDKLSVSMQIACGLNFIHEQGIVHRDVAARNVLLTMDLVAKISDCTF
jgi:serine/threonine protein kinase